MVKSFRIGSYFEARSASWGQLFGRLKTSGRIRSDASIRDAKSQPVTKLSPLGAIWSARRCTPKQHCFGTAPRGHPVAGHGPTEGIGPFDIPRTDTSSPLRRLQPRRHEIAHQRSSELNSVTGVKFAPIAFNLGYPQHVIGIQSILGTDPREYLSLLGNERGTEN